MDPLLIDDGELRLIRRIQHGFPLVPRPFALIAQQEGLTESAVLTSLAALQQRGVIKRMGIVVRHRELGYRANAMVVWQIPPAQVTAVGEAMSRMACVTLCYQRRPHPPDWPYNLYCMIHGRERHEVLQQVEQVAQTCGLTATPREVLFSKRRFKQRGAHYGPIAGQEELP